MTSQTAVSESTVSDMDAVQSLVVRAQQRDHTAYATLVARFQDMAVGYASSLLGDWHLAQDAAQEAFVEAYLGLESLRDPAAFAGWFRRIVFKHCDRFTRRRQVRVARLDEALAVPAAGGGPAELAEVAELREAVRMAVARLPEPERTATTLFYVATTARPRSPPSSVFR